MRYRIKDVCFSCDEATGKSRIINGVVENGTEMQCRECITEDNPKIAFSIFMSRVSETLWNELADKLEKHGISRYTGEMIK